MGHKTIDHGMDLYEYKNYEDYKKAQTEGNKRKLHSHSGVGPEVIAEIKKRIPFANFILCHGTRAGWEQKHFKNAYGDQAYVMGTEISDTASQFDMTTEWDFSKPKDEWISKFDIVYSNSFDHSITPKETLSTWIDQLSPGGSLILEMHLPKEGSNWVPTKTDPLSYTREECIALIEELNLKIVDNWPSPPFTDHRKRFGKYAHGRPTLRIQK